MKELNEVFDEIRQELVSDNRLPAYVHRLVALCVVLAQIVENNFDKTEEYISEIETSLTRDIERVEERLDRI